MSSGLPTAQTYDSICWQERGGGVIRDASGELVVDLPVDPKRNGPHVTLYDG